MGDAAEARRLLRAGCFPDPTPARPETPMTPATAPAPVMPPDLYESLQYQISYAANLLAGVHGDLEGHYRDPSRPGEYRTGEYPRGLEDTWHRLGELAKAAGHLADEFKRYRPADATDPAPATRAM